MSTDIDVYQPAGQPEQYQARLTMTPEQAKALDDQVRLCTRAVLREGTDYGVIPGAGDSKILLKPGAEKLLQWFGFGFTCDRIDLEVDEDGQKQGVTYRCTITKQLPEGRIAAVTTCEGYAGYDELKFFAPVTDAARHKAEARERGYAAKDRRPADPTKWKNLQPYKAPWNTIIKMAQKRAIVGAAITATAAAGLFSQEEDSSSPVADDGLNWFEQALIAVADFTDIDVGRSLYTEAAEAHKNGLCNKKQQDLIQNMAKKRGDLLKRATPVDVEDLGRQAAAADPTPPAAPAATATDTGSSTALDAEGRSDLIEDEPGTVSKAQLTKLHTVLTGLGFNGEDRDAKLRITEAIIGRPLGGSDSERSSKNLSWTEARKVIDTLGGMDRDQLIAYMAAQDA